MKYLLVLISGPPRSGKNRLGNDLSGILDADHFALSDALKRMTHAHYGLDPELDVFHFEDRKDAPAKEFGGLTPRAAYIHFSESILKPEPEDGGGQRRPSGAAARPEATPPMERRGPAALPAPPLAIGRVPRRGQDLARAGPRRAARLGQHEDPVLPGRRRDQPEAARGRFLRPIPRHRHDPNARNAPFRALGAAGRAWPPHARPRCPAPRSKTPLRPAPQYTPEPSEGRVVQQPRSSEVPPPPGRTGGASPPGTREKPDLTIWPCRLLRISAGRFRSPAMQLRAGRIGIRIADGTLRRCAAWLRGLVRVSAAMGERRAGPNPARLVGNGIEDDVGISQVVPDIPAFLDP